VTYALKGSVTAGQQAADPGLNVLLPIQLHVQSAGVLPLKVAAGISSQAIAAAVSLLPAQSEGLKTLVGAERAE
jgi:hypothetical protein